MYKRALHTGRQLLLGIMALQILNLSVGNAFTEDDYDYSYAYNKTYDPTETALEWIVELRYGQQPAFSYTTHEGSGKCLLKTFHWKTDLPEVALSPLIVPAIRRRYLEMPDGIPASAAAEILSPPPECPIA